MVSLPAKTLLALLPFFIAQASAASGTGTTTRYWDCCKPSCSWTKKITLASGATPVLTCDINDSPLSNFDAVSACNGGGPAYMCANESPWAVSSTLSYGYAAVNIAGGTESSWCCACYQLTFTSGPVAGKQMIVQATNTGGDLGSNQFDLSIPGGGFGIFNGCTSEWGTPSTGWGAQYGGISSRSQCDAFPAKLRDGCYWRYDWFQNADNPSVSWTQVTCPAALTAKTGCVRSGEVPTGAGSSSTWTSGAGAATSSTSKASSSSSTLVTTTSSKAATTTTSKAATTSVSTGSGTAAQYAQCGGNGYTGPTVCASPYTCKVSNAWYSQCL